MGIAGRSLRNTNVRLRLLIYIFFGIAAFGSVLYWQTQALKSAEYIEFSNSQSSRTKNENNLRSNRYQIETFETSPSIN
jgi:hypothetical protein